MSDARATTDWQAIPRLAPVALAAIVALALYFRATSPLGHDSTWLLLATQQMLDGWELHRDILEVNPPLAVWINLPPVLAADVLGVRAEPVFVAYTFALAALSLGVIAALLRRAAELTGMERSAAVVGAALGLLIAPAYDFGQREHLMLILVLPYVLLAALRAARRPVPMGLALLIGICAAVGLCLKPHFLLIPAALEGVVLIHTRSLLRIVRPETLALAAGVIGYVVAVLLFDPAFIEVMLPIALEIYNQSYRGDPVDVYRVAALVLVLAMFLIPYALRFSGIRRDIVVSLLLATLAQIAIFAAQGKGWHYQIVPAYGFLVTAFVFCAAASRAVRAAADAGPLARAAGPLLALALPAALLLASLPQQRYDRSARTIAHAIDGLGLHPDSYHVFSAHVFHAFPLNALTTMSFTGRESALWMLPGIAIREALAKDDPESWTPRMEAIVRTARTTVLDDLEREAPDVVLVHDAPAKDYFEGLPFDYVEWFSRDPRFQAVWSNYEKAGTVEGENLVVYRRKTPE